MSKLKGFNPSQASAPQDGKARLDVSGAAPPKLDIKLADLELRDTVGTGTFGRVRVCRDKRTSKYYALKCLKKSEIVRLKQIDHIKSEKNILSHVDHPFVVNLQAWFQDDRSVYMLFDYVAGGEMFSHLRNAGRFSQDTAKFYAGQIVDVFASLHKDNIIYRDLKPENLLIDAEGFVRVTDFGFAKQIDDRTWTLCGTPEYLAPEIIQSKGHGKAVDWWALGILLYEMLAGFPPFYDENPFGIYQKILVGKFEFPRHFSPEARDLIKRFLQADRTKRIGNLRNGAEDVRNHAFFKGLDWKKLYDRKLTPPFVPPVSHPGSTQNFEKYDESFGDSRAPNLSERDREAFKTF